MTRVLLATPLARVSDPCWFEPDPEPNLTFEKTPGSGAGSDLREKIGSDLREKTGSDLREKTGSGSNLIVI